MKTNWILLFLAAFSFAFSLLAIFKAPSLSLWILEIGATEYGPRFALLPLIMILFSFTRFPSWLAVCAAFLAFVAMILLCVPTIQSARLAKKLPAQLQQAFGAVSPDCLGRKKPFSWSKVLFGIRSKPLIAKSFVYATHKNQSLHFDYYRSSARHVAPCVIVLHTGGWNNGTPAEFVRKNEYLAHRGYSVAAVEYRLAPRWKWPAQKQDVLDALAYLKQNASQLGIDPTKFVLLGRSAGGQLAEAVAYSAHDPSIRGCIAFYAPADLEFAYRFGSEDDILDSLKLLRDFLGGTPKESPANYHNASPIFFVNSKTPPTLLLQGKNDPLVWHLQSERLAAALEKAHVPHLLIEPRFATHAFDYRFSGADGQISTYAVEYFLAAVTKDIQKRTR